MANIDKFFTATLHNKPAKMVLMQGGGDTGEFLLVLGSESPKLKRSLIAYRIGYKKLADEVATITDDIEKEVISEEKSNELDIALACDMVTGSSFKGKPDIKRLLTENKTLSKSVIEFSVENTNYLKKN